MKILMVLDKEFPPDERVEKEALTLVNEEYEVHLLCLSYQKKYLVTENYKNIIIHRFFLKKSLRNKLFAFMLVLPIYKMIWYKTAKKIIKKNKIETIHIHDLPLTDVMVKLKKKYDLKLVCDQHEYYSSWIINTALYTKQIIGKIFRLTNNWAKYEKKYLAQADLIITVEEPLKKCYINEVGLAKNKIITLPNTPLSTIFNSKNVTPKFTSKYKNNFVLLYIGGIDILRGINLIFKSLKKLKIAIPEIKFVMAGSIQKYYDPKEYITKNNIENEVDFIGWIPLTEIPSLIAASDVCLFTPPVNREEINNTIATKIYQYIAMGKPVIVSQAKMMKDFVEKNQIGFSVNDSNAEELTNIILKLYKNSDLKEKIKNNALKTSEKYFWETTSLPLTEFYKYYISN